ncbi:MAG: single-stranded DNA-binding protein [Actinomycetota bacterium]
MDNFVSFSGNLTRDPELKYTSSGKAVAVFGVAVNRRFQGNNGEWLEKTDFIDVSVWAGLAENLAESLTSGARVVVTGRFQQDRWENEGGEKRSKLQVIATDIGASMRFATVAVTKASRSVDNEGELAEQHEPAPAG